MLRDGFDVEGVNEGWATDIEEDPTDEPSTALRAESATSGDAAKDGAIAFFERTIRDPRLDTLQASSGGRTGTTSLEVSTIDPQAFLATQLEVLAKLKLEASEEKNRSGSGSGSIDSGRLARTRGTSLDINSTGDDGDLDQGRVKEHIGPVQFNMGGIQVDADDMLQKLKVSRAAKVSSP